MEAEKGWAAGSDGVARLCRGELLSCFSQRGHSYAEQGPQMTTSQSRIGAGEVLVLGVSSAWQALILAGGTAWWGGGRCRRRRWPESWFQTHLAPVGGGQGLAALVHTCAQHSQPPCTQEETGVRG